MHLQKVALVATTNNVGVIEKALLRHGRIDYLMEVKKPSKSAKKLVLSQYLDGSNLNLPLPLKETLINSADTFAELKGALQHMLRAYVSTGDFPPVEEVARMIGIWKEARVEGISEKRESRIGMVPL